MNRTQQEQSCTRSTFYATASMVALMGALIPLVAGCTADVNGALVIAQNQIPEVKPEGCFIPAKESETRALSGFGQYDVGLDKPYPYYFYPLIRNDMPPSGTETMIELNRIEYTGVEVKLEPPAGFVLPSTANCPTEFYYPERASLLPAGTTGSAVQIFLPCHAAALRPIFESNSVYKDTNTIVMFKATVRAVGKLGGDKVRSDPFEWRVRVCLGCLQEGYAGDFAAIKYPMVPVCSAIEKNPYPGNACNPAQDQPILCCDNGGKLVCPAP